MRRVCIPLRAGFRLPAVMAFSSIFFTARGQALSDSALTRIIQRAQAAGAAIRVIKDKQVVFALNVGYADLENKIPVSDHTQFCIMSITKPIIACGIMQLVDAKKLDLSDVVTKYVSGLPAAYGQVTIKELLSHTSGVPDYVHAVGYMQQANKPARPMELLKPILPQGLEFEPGTKSAYSNSNYILLGLVIERVSRQKLSAWLKTEIFRPLGMDETMLEEASSNIRGKARGYTAGSDEFVFEHPLDPSQYWAAGGIVTTAADLSKFDIAFSEGKVVPAKLTALMTMPVKLNDSSNTDYGLGFELMRGGDLQLTGATGVGVGFNAANVQFSNTGATIIVLTNTTNGKSAMIAKQINDLILPTHTQQASAVRDSLDNITVDVINRAINGQVETSNFISDAAAQKFRELIPFIKMQGKLLGIQNKGQKINPNAIVRRYLITFEKADSLWVIVFSKDNRIVAVNHI